MSNLLKYSTDKLRDSSWAQSMRLYMQGNTRGYLYHADRWNRNSLISRGFLEVRTQLKVLGESLARCKLTDDDSEAIEIVNSSHYRWTRNNFDMREVLENIFGDYFRECDDCNRIDFENNFQWAYHDQCICESCINDGYTYSESRDTYVTFDDADADEYDEEEEDNYPIGSYHSSKRKLGHIPSEFDQRKKPIFLGLELEMEINEDNYSRSDRAEVLLDAIGNHKGHLYACAESDGSLDYGFEIVTGYTGLDVHREQLEFFKSPFRGAKSHDTRTCGLHIHICKSDMSVLHGAKMVFFINDDANHDLIKAIARRDASSFAKLRDKKSDKSWLKDARRYQAKRDYLKNLNSDRYEALNFQNEKTIEFRLFKGTLKYETIMACLEFTYSTWFFTRDMGSNELSTPNFLEFISRPENRKDTRFLRKYLIDKGFNLPKSGIVKTNPRIESSASSAIEV